MVSGAIPGEIPGEISGPIPEQISGRLFASGFGLALAVAQFPTAPGGPLGQSGLRRVARQNGCYFSANTPETCEKT